MERELLSVLSTLCPRDIASDLKSRKSDFPIWSDESYLHFDDRSTESPILVNGSQRSFSLKSFLKTSGNTESYGDVTWTLEVSP